MRPRNLARLVRQNLRRNAPTLALAGAGIAVGVATLVFFLALAAGARAVLLGDVFPIDRIEIVPPRATLGGGLLGGGTRIDDDVVARIAARPEVASAHPRLHLAFPARGWGGKQLLGREFHFEVSGFLDGIDPAFVAGEPAVTDFRDFEAGGARGACTKDADCRGGDFCAWDLHECQQPVPAIVSRHLLEIYNGSVAPAHGWPRIRDWVASRFRGLTFTVELGRSYLGDEASRPPAQRRFRLAGISDRAMTFGMTVPLGYVRRWNAAWAPEGSSRAARGYSSVVARVRDKRDVTSLVAFVRSLGLDQRESEAERVGLFVTLATLLFALVSGAIVAVAALSVAHTYLMLVAERRREIGVLRAVGASRRDVAALLLGEAAGVGLAAGTLGVVFAAAAARVCDALAARWLPDFPFKPASFFHFSPALVLGALAFAAGCCVLGALVPARRAARLDPAEALAQ